MEKNGKVLLDKYLMGKCTLAEAAIIEDWYCQLPSEGPVPEYSVIEMSKGQVWEGLCASGNVFKTDPH
jgi:hypothetical protein